MSTPLPQLHTPQGPIQGSVAKSGKGSDYFCYYGIPFAQKPKRFEPPEKWIPWEGLLDATKPTSKKRSPQCSSITKRIFGSEDCLFLNVFTPEKPQDERQSKREVELLPVMVFIYGGGYVIGGGDLYGGKYLTDQSVILVTFNYRLGALGFLTTCTESAAPRVRVKEDMIPGNIGMRDQVMCLRWIQENISYFGGDKNRVVLFGESAGASAVHLHMMSPLSKGLFQRAIMQSGSSLSPWAITPSDPINNIRALIKKLDLECDLNDVEQMVDVLKEEDPFAIAIQRKDYKEWIADRSAFAPPVQQLIPFWPIVETYTHLIHKPFLPTPPVDSLKSGKIINQVPLIIGQNSQEGAYKAIPILKDSKRLRAVQYQWGNEVENLLLLKNCTQSQKELAKSIRDFYFPSNLSNTPITQINWDNKQRFIDLISDRWFSHSVHKTMCYHSKFQKEDLWLYFFDYEGKYSYLNSFSIFDTFGATHADELQYLMDQRIFYSDIEAEGREEDKLMIEKMSSLWARFAHGDGKMEINNVQWEPISQCCEGTTDEAFKLLKIMNNGKATMINEKSVYDEGRMQFWDKLLEEDSL